MTLQCEISHVLNETTPKIQQRKWGPLKGWIRLCSTIHSQVRTRFKIYFIKSWVLIERGIYSRGLEQHIYMAQQTQSHISFFLDPWNCENRGKAAFANVAYNIDWINNKIRKHRRTNVWRSSGSSKFKSHVFTLSFIMSGIYRSHPA